MIDATGGALERPVRLRAVVLVEGLSDRIALEAVASRRGRSLSAEGVSVVDLGGAKNVGRSWNGPARLDSTSRSAACTTQRRSLVSAALSSGWASDRSSLEPTWNGWASSPAWRISRTS
jgi:hypothetical protein